MPPSIVNLSPAELKRRLDAGEAFVLLDVREPVERAYCALPGPPRGQDLHVPLREVPAHLDAIRDAAGSGPLIVYCHHGVRSLMAGRWLAEQGVPDVHNLDGGIDAYSLEADPNVPRY